MSTVFLNLSELSYSVDCADDTRFVFQFPVGAAEVSRPGDDLVFVLENGVSITLKDFYASYTAQNMPAFEVEGVEIAGADFFAALDQPELMPAAGPEPANDSHYQEWSNMDCWAASTATAASTPAGRTAGVSTGKAAVQAAMPNRLRRN